MAICIYCGLEKADSKFSAEHIWPSALGGDHLDKLWRTEQVCEKCNKCSGLFVDAAFIKSWFGHNARALGTLSYIPDNPNEGVFPFFYMGDLRNDLINQDEKVEIWLGPHGEQILRFRPHDEEAIWNEYVGGDPRKNGTKTGIEHTSR